MFYDGMSEFKLPVRFSLLVRLLVMFYKQCFFNVLVSERCAYYGFVTAMVFNAVYSTCSIKYKSPRLRDI